MKVRTVTCIHTMEANVLVLLLHNNLTFLLFCSPKKYVRHSVVITFNISIL